jgi:hypothetical protein
MEAGASGRYSIAGFCSKGFRSFDKLAEWKAEWKVKGGQVLSANNYQFCRQRLGAETLQVRKGLALVRRD